jgi:UDPglucose 6-dehydrogenase
VQRIRTNCTTAEMIKYTSNSLLATLISFANEIANLCATIGGVDAMDVMEAMRTSQYLNRAPIADFLVPGCGFGGSCLPKDISALIAQGRSMGASMRVLEAVRETNSAQPGRMAMLLQKGLYLKKGSDIGLRGLPVTVLGLAFRPGTSDLRESPAIPIIRDLLARGARITAYDPAVVPGPVSGGPPSPEASAIASLFDGAVHLAKSLEEAIARAEGIVLVTRWEEFARLPDLLHPMADPPVVVDGRRMLDKSAFKRYEGIGL